MFNFFIKNKIPTEIPEQDFLLEKPQKDFLIDTYRKMIIGEQKSWVLFENGTCIILMNPEKDLSSQALTLLAEYGSVQSGTPAGDFSIICLTAMEGWCVECHHPDIINYVSPEELGFPPEELAKNKLEMVVGLLGRSKRDTDAKHPLIIHVEDKRV